VESQFVSNDLPLLTDAALRGLGIALLPRSLVARQVERGELLHVLPDAIGSDARVALVYPEKEFLPPQVRAFIDAVVAWAPGWLAAPTANGKRSGARRGA